MVLVFGVELPLVELVLLLLVINVIVLVLLIILMTLLFYYMKYAKGLIEKLSNFQKPEWVQPPQKP